MLTHSTILLMPVLMATVLSVAYAKDKKHITPQPTTEWRLAKRVGTQYHQTDIIGGVALRHYDDEPYYPGVTWTSVKTTFVPILPNGDIDPNPPLTPLKTLEVDTRDGIPVFTLEDASIENGKWVDKNYGCVPTPRIDGTFMFVRKDKRIYTTDPLISYIIDPINYGSLSENHLVTILQGYDKKGREITCHADIRH
jgi:hypothetical protein